MNKLCACLLLCSLIATALAQGTAVKGGYVAEERKPLPPAAEATLRQINAHRAAGANCGGQQMAPAEALLWSDALERAAEVQVRHMARIGDVTHQGPDGSSVGQRITAQGYEWRAAGENAAAGKDSALATLAQWMGSPGHCRNLMGAQFHEVAVARQDNPGSAYRVYWVMVLAAAMR
jgi:uncharacterized protein YkwD